MSLRRGAHDNHTNAATMTLATTTNVSINGVMQGWFKPNESCSGGAERGGWDIRLRDGEASA